MLQDTKFIADADVGVLIETSPPERIQTFKHAAILGNFPPRRCGLATFTRDIFTCLRDANPHSKIEVVAIDDPNEACDYPEEVTRRLPKEDVAAYRALARHLNASGAQVLFIQHEFGIFGGPSGAHLLECLEHVDMPVITTLHTVLERPTPDQRRVMEGLIRRSSTLITMAHKGAEILRRVYGVNDAQIQIIPHGAPTRALCDTAAFKPLLGAEGRQVLMTFGLLSPNKGIETMIEALPSVAKACPDVLYYIVGATHPNLVQSEGERYREGLMARAQELGVDANVRFLNSYLSDDDLIDLLQATDVYITPYLTQTQITSGTLSYALAVGKPVVSTPYWHAEEALANGVGVLCPFNDSQAFATAIIDLLQDDTQRKLMARRAYVSAQPSRWTLVARAYTERAHSDISQHKPRKARTEKRKLRPKPSWQAVQRLSDDTGMFQHSFHNVPDRNHGYCTDDNARALKLMAAHSHIEAPNEARIKWAQRYAAFVNYAWNEETGRFRNFMAFDRRWLDEGGSDDCCARAAEALAEVTRSQLPEELRRWAVVMSERILPHVENWSSMRAHAIILKTLEYWQGYVGDTGRLQALAAHHGVALHNGYRPYDNGLRWFEDSLSYDNARLPEGLLIAGYMLGDAQMKADAIEALRYIMARQSAPAGHFRPVPTRLFAAGQHPEEGYNALFDQQPLEAQASVDACLTALRLTGDLHWKDEALRAWDWFTGRNDHNRSLITADGGCYDGLTPHGVNENQGAESVLALHLSGCALRSAGL